MTSISALMLIEKVAVRMILNLFVLSSIIKGLLERSLMLSIRIDVKLARRKKTLVLLIRNVKMLTL